MQLLSPHPSLLLENSPPPLPQQLNRMMIQIMELHPPPSLHPQFVAAKSLISDLLKILIYSIDYEKLIIRFQKM